MIAKKGRGALVTCDHSYFFIWLSAGIWGGGRAAGDTGHPVPPPPIPRAPPPRQFQGIFRGFSLLFCQDLLTSWDRT